ncbi:hypothetical protein Dimus_017443 [Dionaea muscipula]
MGSEDGYVPLFETKTAKLAVFYRAVATSMSADMCLMWVYRATHIPPPGQPGRWARIGLFTAELGSVSTASSASFSAGMSSTATPSRIDSPGTRKTYLE